MICTLHFTTVFCVSPSFTSPASAFGQLQKQKLPIEPTANSKCVKAHLSKTGEINFEEVYSSKLRLGHFFHFDG